MKPINKWTKNDVLNLLKSVDKKLWGFVALGSLITILFVVFVFLPAWFLRPKMIKEIALLKGRIVMVETLKRRKFEMLENKEQFENLIKSVKNHLFKHGETSFLLGMISRLAEESRVSIVASKPMKYDGKFPEPFNTRYLGSLFEFSVEGDYHSLGTFVSRVESHEKVLRIQSFDLTPIEKDNGFGIRANMTISAVSLQQDVS